MALTIARSLSNVHPNIGIIINADGTYRIGVEDVNSDEILASLVASGVDLAAIEIINTAIQAASEAILLDTADIETATEAINTALQAGGVTQTQLAAMVTSLGFIRSVPVTTNTTGTVTAIATLSPGAAFKLVAVRFNLASALAAAETLTVTSDINTGAAYDTVLYTQDLGTPDIRDLVIPFGDEYVFAAADDIVIALSANVGGDTWGCQTIHELI